VAISPDATNGIRVVRTSLNAIKSNLERRWAMRGPHASPQFYEVVLATERVRLTSIAATEALRAKNERQFQQYLYEVGVGLRGLLDNRDFREFTGLVSIRPFFPGSERERDLVATVHPRLAERREPVEIVEALVEIVDAMGSEFNKDRVQPELFELRRMIPQQKIAPFQFEVENGRLKLLKTTSAALPADTINVEAAKDHLMSDGKKLLDQLQNSNCDKRLVESFQSLQDQLSGSQNIIGIGLSNLGCDVMCDAFKDELPEAVSAMFKAHTKSVEMYVSQFPEWNRFLENVATTQLGQADVEAIRNSANKLISDLKKQDAAVDIEVPKTLARLNELLKSPGIFAKRAAFAMLRSIENLISSVFSYGADFISKTTEKTIDTTSTAISRAVAIGLLTAALAGAASIGPVASKINEMTWLKNATELVQRQIDKIKLE
jgi:hypothetical protein